MNKQELIEKLNREIKELKSTEASCFKLGSKTEEMKFTNRIMGLQLALNWAGQLDEPQKVKVPPFVAEYIDWCKQYNWQLTAMVIPSNAKFFEPHSKPSAVHDWINENYDTFLVAISTDYYEVEEPLYFLKLIEKPVDPDECYLVYEIEEDRYFLDHPSANNKKYKMQFTEKEIKAMDEGYWPFAVPVEKV